MPSRSLWEPTLTFMIRNQNAGLRNVAQSSAVIPKQKEGAPENAAATQKSKP